VQLQKAKLWDTRRVKRLWVLKLLWTLHRAVVLRLFPPLTPFQTAAA